MNTIIYLLVALGALILAIQNGRSFRRYTATGSFVILCALAAVGFGSFGLHLLTMGIFGSIYPITAALLPAALLGFLVRWLEIKEHKADHFLWGLGLAVGVAYVVLKSQTAYQAPTIGAPEYLISVWFFGSCTFGLYWLWNLRAREWEPHRKIRFQQLFGLMIATIVALLIEGWMRLLMPDLDLADITHREKIAFLQGALPPFGAPLAMLSLYVLHLNVKLTRLISLQELFSRLLTQGLMALLLTMLISLTLMLDGDRSSHTGFQIWLIALLFVTFSSDIRQTIGRLSTNLLNRQGSDFQDSLRELERVLHHNLDIDSVEKSLMYHIHDAGRTQMVSVYRWNPNILVFECTGHLGQGNPISSVQAAPLLQVFRYGKQLHRTQNSTPKRFRVPTEDVLALLTEMHADICFPLWSDGVVVGWLNLKLDVHSGGFSHSELDALQQLTQRVSMLMGTIEAIQGIKESHRLHTLGTMSAGLAQELTRPVESLQLSIQAIREDALPDEIPIYAEAAQAELDKLHRWLQEFTIYASPVVPVLDRVELNVQLQNIANSIKVGEKNIQWKWSLLDTLPSIELDPHLLEYVWQHLFQNALDAIENTGTITVTSKLGRCKTGALQGQPALEVRIEDNGCGMSNELKENIFIPFYSTKSDGDGIGLAMVERIIKAHNAEIQTLSSEGEGSSFVVRFPIWHADS